MTIPTNLCIVAMLITTPSSAWSQGSIRIIAVNDGEGAADGTSYSAFSDPVLNEAGQAAFVGFRVVGDFGEPDLAGGAYVGDGLSPLVELVRVGAPSLAPNSMANFLRVEAINDVGQVACFERALSPTGDRLVSGLLLREATSALILVAQTSDLDPDGDPISSIRFADLDVNGRVGLVLGLSARGPQATCISEPGGLRILAKEDLPSPDGVGTVGGTFFPALNDAGQIHYSPRIIRPGLPDRPALFRETPGVGRELLFRSEDPTSAPTIDGTLLLESYTPSMNETGLVAFAGIVSGATDPANDGRGLFIADVAASVTATVREGQAVPGGDTLVAFGRPSLNELGDVAFYALLTDDPGGPIDRENVGLYRQTAAGFTEIARDGQAVPNGNGKFDLRRFLISSTPSLSLRPMFNDIGQVAFLTDLADSSGADTDDEAIYLFDDAVGLVEIVRTGGPLLESTIVDLGLRQSFNNDSDEENGFNDCGQIAFRFALLDGREGVAIWSPDKPGPDSIKLTIIPATAPATGFDLEWDSQPGKVYDLVSSIDLATPILEWPVYNPDGEGGNNPYRDIPAAAANSTTTVDAIPQVGPTRFFAVIEKDAPRAE